MKATAMIRGLGKRLWRRGGIGDAALPVGRGRTETGRGAKAGRDDPIAPSSSVGAHLRCARRWTCSLLALVSCLLLGFAPAAPSAADSPLALPAQAVLELLPLVPDALDLYARATAREAAHAAELRRKGIAEVPPDDGSRHVVEMAGLGPLIFDDWGELSLDRRFVTDDEMAVVRAIERWIAKWFPAQAKAKGHPRRAAGAAGLPVFRGFEHPRYQMHDELIARLVAEFNADKATGCGGTPGQAAKVADLTPALVKAHMIEESGGGEARSRAAWAVDPLQVNVPGDWGDEKLLVGLSQPARRNEGTPERNVRAAIRYLSRKGFSTSARPAAERPQGFFDGWTLALRRYNGRRDRTETDRYYSDEYADKILRRAANPDEFVPIEIRLAKREKEEKKEERKD